MGNGYFVLSFINITWTATTLKQCIRQHTASWLMGTSRETNSVQRLRMPYICTIWLIHKWQNLAVLLPSRPRTVSLQIFLGSPEYRSLVLFITYTNTTHTTHLPASRDVPRPIHSANHFRDEYSTECLPTVLYADDSRKWTSPGTDSDATLLLQEHSNWIGCKSSKPRVINQALVNSEQHQHEATPRRRSQQPRHIPASSIWLAYIPTYYCNISLALIQTS